MTYAGANAGKAPSGVSVGNIEIHLETPLVTNLTQASLLTVSGLWPTACLPILEHITIEDTDIRIEARSRKTLCPQQPTSFTLTLNPAAEFNQSLMPGLYRVSFYTANGSQAPLKLRAFALLNTTDTMPIAPESGFWWSQQRGAEASEANGSALTMELQGNTLLVSTLSYSETGEPVWYFGSGTLDGHSIHLPLLHMHGGTALFDNQIQQSPHAEPQLMLDLEFHSNARATAWFSRFNESTGEPEIELRTLSLLRLPFSNEVNGQAWQGEWVLVSDSPGATPQRLRFDQAQTQDEEHFQLSDSVTGMTLQCHRNQLRSEAPPDFCELNDQAKGLIGQFNAVAIARLDGFAIDGKATRLIRILH